jgi:sugar phosphate isomerase/epimerase
MKRRSFLTAAGAAAGYAGEPRAAAGRIEPGFQLGCVTYNLLRNMELEKLIQVLEAAGIGAVELRTGHRHGVEPSLRPAGRAQVRERFQRSPVRLLSYGTDCEFQSKDSSERKRQVDRARSFVDLARDTGALGVKVRPNGLPEGVPYATTLRNIAGGLREVGDYGASMGIEVWLEVHGPRTSEPEIAGEILALASHKNVGACWNSNPSDVKDGSVKRSLDLLRPYLRNVHINELYSSYPWSELFRLLLESGYRRYTLAEVPESPEPERFLRYYKALWRQMAWDTKTS